MGSDVGSCMFLMTATQITSYPRTLASSVRREDDRRKVKRKQREERKEKEKEIRKEEIRWLRNLREKEVEERLEKLAWTAGKKTPQTVGIHGERASLDRECVLVFLILLLYMGRWLLCDGVISPSSIGCVCHS